MSVMMDIHRRLEGLYDDKVYTSVDGVPFADEEATKLATLDVVTDEMRALNLKYGGASTKRPHRFNEVDETTHCAMHLCRLPCGFCYDRREYMCKMCDYPVPGACANCVVK